MLGFVCHSCIEAICIILILCAAKVNIVFVCRAHTDLELAIVFSSFQVLVFWYKFLSVLLLLFWFFKTGFLCITDLAVLELTL